MTSSESEPIKPIEAHKPVTDAAALESIDSIKRSVEPLVEDAHLTTPRTTQQGPITVHQDVTTPLNDFDEQVNVEQEIHDAAVHGSAIAQAIEESSHSGDAPPANDVNRQLAGAAGVAASGLASPRRTEIVDTDDDDLELTDGVHRRDKARPVVRPTDPS